MSSACHHRRCRLHLRTSTFHSKPPHFPLLNMIRRLCTMLTRHTGICVAGRRVELRVGVCVGLDREELSAVQLKPPPALVWTFKKEGHVSFCLICGLFIWSNQWCVFLRGRAWLAVTGGCDVSPGVYIGAFKYPQRMTSSSRNDLPAYQESRTLLCLLSV